MSNNTFMTKVTEVWGSVKKSVKTYNKVRGFKRAKKRDEIKRFLKTDDAVAIKSGIFTILMDGLFISGLLYYFIGFQWLLVPAFGAGWFWLKRDGIKQLVKILESINLIKIGK